MTTFSYFKSKPYSPQQLAYFEAEIKEAGSFELLMVKKEAMLQKNRIEFTVLKQDRVSYPLKHLTGIYKSLRPLYNTDTPFTFWVAMHQKLQWCYEIE